MMAFGDQADKVRIVGADTQSIRNPGRSLK